MTAHQTITDDQIKKSKLIAGSGGGGGGGGGSEKDDDLESTSTLTIVELLGEGQIGGLVNKSPSSIFLNDTPLASSTGQYNFKNVNWGIVDGTQGQASLGDGFNEVESSFSVNSKVTKTSPAKITVTDPNADKIRVIVSTPALIHTDSKGNIGGSEVEYRFTISLNNGPFSEIGTGRIKGKTRSKYQRQYTYDLPKKTLDGTKVTMWTIEMERITGDSNSSSTSNDLFLDNYSVITASRLTYPNSAVVGISFDAEQFSGVPTRSYLVDGLIIRVPSNRDSITRDYVGTWDGTFKLDVCDNPAWILYDLLTNKRYGLGNYVPAEYANPARLYTIGKYCDQMVDDGYGKKEPRFTINTCINTRMDAHQLISEIASVFNGMAYWTGNQIGYMCDMPTPVTMIYSAANVVNGEFQYSGAQRKDMHSIVLVTYNDPENNYEPAVEYVEDAEMIDRFGIRKVEITAFGCTSRAQAQRVGRWMLYTERHQSKTVSFKVGIDSAFVMPGDVIKIADPNRAGQRQGGRLISCTKTSAILDGKIEAPAGSSISIRLEDGTFADRLIGTVADYESDKSAVTWVTELTKLPVSNAVWVVKTPELEPMIARVIAVGQGETIGEFSITAVQHNESKFNHIEKDILLDIPNVSKINPSLMTAPESVEIATESRIDQGIAVHNMVISWNQVKNAIGYEVQYRKDDGNWLTLPIAKMPLIEIANVFQGSYTAKVAALSSSGAKSPFTWSLPTVVDGQVAVLPKPGLLTATPAMFSIVVEWEYAAGTTGVAFTELEVSEDGGSTFTLLTTAPDPTKQYIHNGLALGNVRFYRARVVDKYGFKSPWSDVASASPDNDASKVLEVLENKIGIDYLSEDVRTSMNDAAEKARIANEAIAKEVSDRAAAITQEQTDRANAIVDEATARANAISTAITKEVSDRNAAIASKAVEINNAVDSKISTVTTSINKEVQDRKDAIANETALRVSAISSLQDGLTTETTQRKSEDASLLSNIETFKTSTNNSLASVQQQTTTNANNISSQATQINSLDSRLTNTDKTANDAKLAAATAQTTANTAVTQSSANASNITSLNAALGALDSDSLLPDYAMANASNWMSHYGYQMAQHFKTTTTGKITNTVFRKDGSNPITCWNYNQKPLPNTKPYKVSFWVRRSSDSNGACYITRLMGNPNGEFLLANYGHLRVENSEIPADETWTYIERVLDLTSQESQFPRFKLGFAVGHNSNATGWWELQGFKVVAVIGVSDVDSTIATSAALATLDTKVTDIDGRVNANSQSITSLNNEVATVKASVATKAESSALNALQSTVTSQGNTITSQGNSITNLTNRVTSAESGLATKADSSTVSALDSKVTQQGSTISSQGSAITKLQNDLNATNSIVNTKASASALNTLDNKVTSIEGDLASQSTSITTLSNNLNVTDRLAQLQSKGKPLTRDPNFKVAGGLALYNPNSTTNVSFTHRVKSTDNPSGSTNEYFIAVPNAVLGVGVGGYPSPQISSAANKIFLFKVVAKAPNGALLRIAKNASGDNSVYEILGNNTGTGNFETYYFWLKSGAAGTFSTVGHFTFSQGTAPVGTAQAPFQVVIASYEVWDVTAVDDTIPKEWADKVDASTSAISSLTSTVSQQGNTISSTSSAVTSLTNRVSTVENQVSTKAETSALNTLDSKVTSIDGKVTTNTSAITALGGRVTNVEGSLANKADASALNSYSTKTETNSAIASGISQYDANLSIGGVNVLANSEGERTSTAATNKEYLLYERSAELKAFYDENLEKPVTISFEMSVPVVGAVQVYSSNSSAHTYSAMVTATEANKFVKYQVTATPQKHPSTPTATQSTLEFYGTYGTGRIPTVRKVQVEAGNKATSWSPSPRDVKASLDANASAISTTNANVAALDGRVTSSSNEITTLKNRVNSVEGAVSTKAESSAVQTLDSRVTAAEGSLASQSGNITKLQNDLAVSAVASDNILMKSNVPGSYAYGKYPHVVYEGYEDMVVGDTYTVIVCWEHKRGTGDTNSALAIYAGGGSQSVGSINGGTAGTGKIVSKYTFVKNSAISAGLLHTIRFYMLNQPGSDKASVGEVYWAVLVRGASINTDRWIPSKYDLSSSVTANSNAIQSLTSTVNTIDGKVVSNTNAITNLSNRVTTAEGNITSTSNAVNTLTSRVTAAEGSISSQGSQITSLNNNLVATTNTANAALPQVVQSNGNYKLFRSVLAYENNTINLAGNIVIQTPITINAKMFKIIGSGYNYTDNKTDISFTVGGYAYNNSNIIRHSATNTGSIPMRIRLGVRNSTVCLILSSLMPGNTWQYPKLNLDAEIGYVGIPINWVQGWSAEIVIESDLASYGITGIVEPSQLDMGTEISANASAISSLTNIVTQQGNSITSQSSSITSLQNSISTINSSLANKAETSAVNNLSGRVTAAEGSITSLSNQTTSLSASITKTINEITINDTRADNQPPSWYWANYPKRKVIEFKSASALGLTGMGLYVSLESLVQWTDSSGGSIKQVARSGDELNAQHRYSVGTTSWSAWKPYIKELTDQGNANATAINTLNSQVTTINGTVTAQSTAITKLQAAATISEIKVTGVSDALVGGILYGTETPTVSFVTEPTSASNKVIRFGDNSGVDYTAYCNDSFVAIDPNKLYRFKYRYRRVTGDGGVYLFIQCANADKSLNVTAGNTTIAITTISSANYVVSNAKPALNTWVEGEYYFKGKSTGASTGAGTISSPRTFPALAAFIRVGGLFNYNTGPGQQDLDYIMVEDFDAGAQGDSTATALNTLDAKVTTIDGKVTTQATSLNSLSTTVNGHTTTINNQATTINGIKGVKTLTIDTNGVISGYGLVSELIDGRVVSNFGINATNFFIGPPSSNKKPFIVTTSSQTINGVTYPAGTWIDTAYIASASIKLAHIDSATIKELQAGTVTTVGADGSKRITSGAVDRLYAPNGKLVLEIGILS